MSSEVTVDLAIIGAGAAGLELARIASRAGLKVALIEKGSPGGRHLFQRVPLLVGKIIGNPRFVDLTYSAPQQATGNRRIPVLTGRGLGGSSRVNGNVAYVGPAERYARVFGPLGLDFSRVLSSLSRSAGQKIDRTESWSDALSARFIAAAAVRVPQVADPDLDGQFVGTSLMHVNTRRGFRSNHFEGYRRNANHANIHLIRATAVSILFDGPKAIGVSYQLGANRQCLYAGETILSAGAIGSPTLLLQSGIGPAAMLEHAGRDVFHDLPHVGQHLKDHANLRLQFSCPGHNTLNQSARGLSAIWEGAKFLAGRSDTVLRGPGASAGLNLPSRGDAFADAYRIQLIHFTQDRSLVSQKGIMFEKEQKASLGLYAIWPRSEGSVTLARDGVQIDQGFLTDQADVETSCAAMGVARTMIADMGFSLDRQLHDDETTLRQGVYSGYHLIGSNRMSVNSDTGVVAPDFTVHGLSGISICDASVMPDHLSTHSYLPTVALARKFAESRGWAV